MAVTHTQISTWADEYAALRIEKEKIEMAMEDRKKQLMAVVPKGESMMVGERKVTHSVAMRTTLNQALLKLEAPGLVAKYSETKEVESLLVK